MWQYANESVKETERRVLGAILIRQDLLRLAQGVIPTPDVWVHDAHRWIWRGMCAADPCDLEQLGIEVMRFISSHEATHPDHKDMLDQLGGPRVVTSLMQDLNFGLDIEKTCRDIVDRWQVREVQRVAMSLVEEAGRPGVDATALLTKARTALEEVESHRPERLDDLSIAKRGYEMKERLVRQHSGEEPRIFTGLDPVDALLDGIPEGRYVILSAYSKHGKTTLAGSMMIGMARSSGAVLSVHQCEVAAETQTARLLAAAYAERGLTVRHMTRGDKVRDPKTWEKIMSGVERAINFAADEITAYIEDPKRLRLSHIEAQTRLIRAKHPRRPIVVMVDYIQRVTVEGRFNTRQLELEEISRRLLELSKETGAIVFALSQFTERDLDKVPIPMPKPATQIRGARDIVHDADLVLTWHRPYKGGRPEEERMGILEISEGREHTTKHVALDADLGRSLFTWSDAGSRGITDLRTPRVLQDGSRMYMTSNPMEAL
jgi:replicative DNA helicase